MFGNVYHRLFTSVNGTKNMKANCFLYLYSLHFSLSYGVSGVIKLQVMSFFNTCIVSPFGPSGVPQVKLIWDIFRVLKTMLK